MSLLFCIKSLLVGLQCFVVARLILSFQLRVIQEEVKAEGITMKQYDQYDEDRHY